MNQVCIAATWVPGFRCVLDARVPRARRTSMHLGLATAVQTSYADLQPGVSCACNDHNRKKRCVGLPADQLTRPILQPLQAFRPHLPSFGCKSTVQTTHWPFDNNVSGLRLVHQYSNSALSNA